MTLSTKQLVSEIRRLKREKNAIILVHNYQRPEIYEVADFIGDSLGLCREAMKTNASIIVFCGVKFMAESAVILNPDKKVVVPFVDAGCAMADMVNVRKLIEFKKKYPDAAVVTYVNSTAEVKSLSDVCCTSSNAVKVVKAMPNRQIIFVPDKNLAAYIAEQVPEKEIIAWEGFCPVHNYVTKQYLDEVKSNFPTAKIIAHPESKPEILEVADYISSTTGMIDCAKNAPEKDFFILTECGMIERLKREVPGKNFHGLCNICFDMKKNTLESVYKSLLEEKFVIRLDRSIIDKARKTFDRMFELTS